MCICIYIYLCLIHVSYFTRKQNSVKQLKNNFEKKKKKDGGVICTPVAKSSRFMAEIKPIL